MLLICLTKAKPHFPNDMTAFFSASPEMNSRNRNDGPDTLETIPEAVPVEFTEPPIEEQLAWNTLWPESHKLYGHGNEIYSLCCDHGGKLVASSCKVCSMVLYLKKLVTTMQSITF